MTDGRDGARRPARAPLRPRSRRRWAIAGGIVFVWAVLEVMTHSLIAATVVLVLIAALVFAAVAGLRAMGITRDHPWLRQMAARPWRDGQDALNVAMRHLSDVFVITPSGSLLAPNVVEIQLNPESLRSLCDRMELGVINASVTEVYAEQVASSQARFAGPGRADVYVVADSSIPPGRYRLRQGLPVSTGDKAGMPDAHYPDAQYGDAQYRDDTSGFTYVAPQGAYGMNGDFAQQGGDIWSEPSPASAAPGGTVDGRATVMERRVAPVPVLRLITGQVVSETVLSGARAGRGAVELVLPDAPTVSREHARFTYSDGRWWVTNQGMNGLTLNGASLVGEQPVSDGDEIRWGLRPDALLSRVEIG
jgi:hypothetical protein